MNEKLVILLYFLMRDKLPVGEVIQIINLVNEAEPGRVVVTFTNKDLENLARDLVRRLE